MVKQQQQQQRNLQFVFRRSSLRVVISNSLVSIYLFLLWLIHPRLDTLYSSSLYYVLEGGGPPSPPHQNNILYQNDGTDIPIQSSNLSATDPISCIAFLKEHSERKNITNSANNDQLYLRYTVVEPHFWISLHNEEYDVVRWSVMKYGKYYEQVQSQAFINILSKSRSPRLIDVGGNIGWFSLLAAAMGADVDVFEPNPNNILRTCESLCVNDWLDGPCPTIGSLSTTRDDYDDPNGRMRIFPVGVGRTEEVLHLLTYEGQSNPGEARVFRKSEFNDTWLFDPDFPEVEPMAVPIVSLDKLANELGWYDESIDILKIDVEGFELDVLLGATNFLKSNVVKHIFMEGDTMIPSAFKDFVGQLVDAGYMMYKIGGYLGPTHNYAPPRDENFTENLLFQCGAGNRRKCNLWWKLANV